MEIVSTQTATLVKLALQSAVLSIFFNFKNSIKIKNAKSLKNFDKGSSVTAFISVSPFMVHTVHLTYTFQKVKNYINSRVRTRNESEFFLSVDISV